MSAPGELVVATQNAGKLAEIRALLGDARLVLRSLADWPELRLPEEGDEYLANAVAKARAVARATGLPAVGDDSGLEVAGLGGRPGPHSARYGGPGLDDAGRLARLLEELGAATGAARAARFVCLAALATPAGGLDTARGECAGRILAAPRGVGGFGYDPVFQPDGERVSMAELPAAAKNRLSHRARAFAALRGAIERRVLREARACPPAAPGAAGGARVSTGFVLIRHAESAWNAAGRWQGQADPPLSARGVEQAEALARELAGEPADRLLSSDLQRAHQTAQVLGRALGLAPECDPRLRELDVGRWSGLTRAEIAALDPRDLARFEAGDPEVAAGGAESRAGIRRRVRRVFRDLADEHPGERLVVVTHLGVVRALLPGTELPNAGWVRAAADELAAP